MQDDITKAVALYHEGIFESDLEKLRRVFHPDARLVGEVKGAPYEKTLSEYLAIVAGREAPAKRGDPYRMKILSIEARGAVALAKVFTPVADSDYVDFLSFKKSQEGAWRIVHKLFSDAPPP